MSNSKQMVSIKYKEQYLELIVKQKTAALNHCQQQTSELIINFHNGEDLLNLTHQPICKSKKLEAKDAIPMTDDDFLLAELNGHFE